MIKILEYKDVSKDEIFKRSEPLLDVSDAVAEIIDDVKKNGDEALFRYCEKFDGAKLDSLEASEDEIKEALSDIEPKFLEVLKKSSENIKRFHEKQKRDGFEINDSGKVITGQRITPIEKVGLYVPGGTAAYPSTVLMDSIPAKIAGCSLLVIATPPGSDGKISSAVLAAAHIAGVDKIYKMGGSQAIAALAYGTETVEKVDMIAGPGNAYVAEAKKQVFGKVSIDMIAGPSEILVIADEDTRADVVAADMLSQAEHDKNASSVLITDSKILAENVAAEIDKQIPELERAEIASASIENNGKIIITNDIEEAFKIANEIAPEHLELCVKDAFEYLNKIKNAGSVFIGKSCPEALGDYMAGPNHTLPTSGTARFSNPLSVDDFVKKTQYIYYDEEEFKKIANDVAFFANKEGLTAHAKSALIRLEDK